MSLDLGVPRDLGGILGDTFELFRRHLALFFLLALTVVAPMTIGLDGIWGGAFADGFDAEPSFAYNAVSTVLSATVVPATITALHVRAVERIAAGEAPSVGRAFRDIQPVIGQVVLVVALYTLAVMGGFVLLVIPGIWLAVRLYFGAQAAVVESRKGRDALRRSAQLVDGMWWRVFGILLLVGLVTSIFAGVFGVALGLATGLILGEGVGVVTGYTIGNTIAYSLGALAATLLFFDLKARTDPVPRVDPSREFLPPEAGA